MLRRLVSQIDAEEFCITGCSEADSAAAILNQERFDIVIVDDLVEDAAKVCEKAACDSGAPVALLLGEKPTNWSKLRDLTVDGYIQDGTGKAELMARIRAYTRRFPGRRLAVSLN